MMPFGNNLLVHDHDRRTAEGRCWSSNMRSPSGRAGRNRPSSLRPQASPTRDMSKPEGSRVSAMRLNGKPLRPDGRYRVAVNNYLASGGDGLSAFTKGTDVTDMRDHRSGRARCLDRAGPDAAQGRTVSASLR